MAKRRKRSAIPCKGCNFCERVSIIYIYYAHRYEWEVKESLELKVSINPINATNTTNTTNECVNDSIISIIQSFICLFVAFEVFVGLLPLPCLDFLETAEKSSLGLKLGIEKCFYHRFGIFL